MTRGLETERTPALHFTFHLLDGVHRQQFLDAIKWTDELDPHLAAIADQSGGAVAAGGIRAGLNDSLVIAVAAPAVSCRLWVPWSDRPGTSGYRS